MIEKLQELVNSDAALVHRGRWMSADMLLQIGDAGHLVKIRDGRVESVCPANAYVTSYDFKIQGTEEAWDEFWKPLPKPRHHDIIALIREGKMQMEGNIEMAMQNFLTLKLMLEKPRKTGAAS